METKRFKIEDVILDISMGPFGSDIKKEVYTDSGVPVLNGSNLQGFELVEDSFGYVTEEKADSLKKANAHSEYSGRAFFAFARLNAQSLRSEVSREALPLQFRKFFFSCIISLFPANLSVKEQSTAAQKRRVLIKNQKKSFRLHNSRFFRESVCESFPENCGE